MPTNIIDAAATAASNGIKLAIEVGPMLLAFISLVALLNGLLGEISGWFGFLHLILQVILG